MESSEKRRSSQECADYPQVPMFNELQVAPSLWRAGVGGGTFWRSALRMFEKGSEPPLVAGAGGSQKRSGGLSLSFASTVTETNAIDRPAQLHDVSVVVVSFNTCEVLR